LVKQEDLVGWVFALQFVVLLKTLVTTHTVEVNREEVAVYVV
jgi:hypothetical protein